MFVLWAFSIAEGLDLVSVWIAICLVLLWRKMGQIKKESLLLMHDLGIQVFFRYQPMTPRLFRCKHMQAPAFLMRTELQR